MIKDSRETFALKTMSLDTLSRLKPEATSNSVLGTMLRDKVSDNQWERLSYKRRTVTEPSSREV